MGAPGIPELIVILGILLLLGIPVLIVGVVIYFVIGVGRGNEEVVQTCPSCGLHVRGDPVAQCPHCGAALAPPGP